MVHKLEEKESVITIQSPVMAADSIKGRLDKRLRLHQHVHRHASRRRGAERKGAARSAVCA